MTQPFPPPVRGPEPTGPRPALRERALVFGRFLWRWHWRVVGFLTAFAAALFVILALSLRLWVLPHIDAYRGLVQSSASQALGQRVTIGAISGGWVGWRPRVSLSHVAIYDAQGRPALVLGHVEGTLSWWPLFFGHVRLYALTIDQPHLSVRRTPDGLIYVAGIAVNRPGGAPDTRFGDWILHEREIDVRRAVIVWQDQRRGAPPLVLNDASLTLQKRFSHHRFSIKASPAGGIATPVDIRGDVRGQSLNDLGGWSGQVYARFDDANLGALARWVPLPVALTQGRGGLRLWLDFAHRQATQVMADVRLKDVRTRLAPALPELDLKTLTGRLGWRQAATGYEISAQHLGLTTNEGLSVPPFDFAFQYRAATRAKAASGSFSTRGLRLAPLVALSTYLPLGRNTRQVLLAVHPSGTFDNLELSWNGTWGALKRYRVAGRFRSLGMSAYGRFPGVSGVTGSMRADDLGGSVTLDSQGATVNLPAVFRAPLVLDALSARLRWTIKDGRTALNFDQVAFANADLAGNVSGSYHTVPGGPGYVDLTAQVNRADARHVGRYIPLIVAPDVRGWLDQAFVSGRSDDVRLRLKGDLARFPFVDRNGIFRVAAQAEDVTLRSGPGWPDIHGIDGKVVFQGDTMDVQVSRASLYGVTLSSIHAQIPHLNGQATLAIKGIASGPTQDFLAYIAHSPVNGMLHGLTTSLAARGPGQLGLSLTLPLAHLQDTRVAGTFRLSNDDLFFGNGGWPGLTHVTGTFDFTQSLITARRIGAQALGGPVSLNVTSRPGGAIDVAARGRMTAAGLRAAVANPWLRFLGGQTHWTARATVAGDRTSFVVDSDLAGLSSALPAPLGKPAGAVLPLHFERTFVGPTKDQLALQLGDKRVAALIVRRLEPGHARVEQGIVSLGGPVGAMARPGLWVVGTLPYLDVDGWRRAFETAGSPPGDAAGLALSGARLTLGTVDVLGRRLEGVRLDAARAQDQWRAFVTADGVRGRIAWDPAGHGRVVARFAKFRLPPLAPAPAPAPAADTAVGRHERLPDLDIVVDQLEMRKLDLGKLTLLATQQDGDWHIQQLAVTAPDYRLRMSGLWQSWLVQPRTEASVQLNVSDIGQFLGRLGYPDSVKGGTADLRGNLSWAGGPAQFNYPTLSGAFTLNAQNGRFLQIRPGIGKLLGILSLQALPHHLAFGFRDIFSKGFAFYDISGSMQMAHGVLNSDDFHMAGPSVVIKMTGDTDLVRESQNLRVRVVPLVGDSVSVAAGALLANPVVGLTTFLVQKALGNPLGRLVSYEYLVSGTWSHPQVVRVYGEPAWGVDKRAPGPDTGVQGQEN
ncbi:MAG: YhdP family protein [Betaproteobacteria bacterium]|nr:YhdP family protein [Betaproteobacteria bacterium]